MDSGNAHDCDKTELPGLARSSMTLSVRGSPQKPNLMPSA